MNGSSVTLEQIGFVDYLKAGAHGWNNVHAGIVAEPDGLLEIVRTVKSPWIGINLDTGNFHTEDPYADLEKIAPYTVNVQLKVEIKRKGANLGAKR